MFKIVFVIIGALIGAGFASGQEVNTFFYSYGLNGIYGIIISSGLIGIIIYFTLKIINENNIKNYDEFLNKLIKNKNFKMIINAIINIFILISFYIMVAGFGAYLKQEYKINSVLGSSIFAFICYFILKKNIKAVIKINELLVPILIFIILFSGLINFKNMEIKNLEKQIIYANINYNWLIKSILYSSYNSVLLIPLLISIKNFIKNDKQIKYISCIVSVIILILLILIFFLLTKIKENTNLIEIPTIVAINEISPIMKKIYGLMILVSIFTTAISLAISFLKNNAENEKKYDKINFFICSSAVVFSTIGFSNLVKSLYPILGVLGILQIIQIFIYQIYCKKYKKLI